MARIRTIKPEFNSSESVNRMSESAQLFMLKLLTECDDYGRVVWMPKKIAGNLYPLREDVDSKTVESLVCELERESIFVRYEVDGRCYGCFPNWNSHQKVDKPGRETIPPPPEGFASVSRQCRESVARVHRLDIGYRKRDIGVLSCGETSQAGSPPDEPKPVSQPEEDASPIVATFPCDGTPAEFQLRQSKVDEWKSTYKTINVDAEIAKARQWCVDNPNNRKTAKGMLRFLGNWFSRAVDRPKSRDSPSIFNQPQNVVLFKIEGHPVRFTERSTAEAVRAENGWHDRKIVEVAS